MHSESHRLAVKLFVVHHLDLSLPDIPTLIPLRSDRDTGKNIADKENYCELRAHYYVWKNEHADYVGFFHYRRYLNFAPSKLVTFPVKSRLRPYTICRFPKRADFQKEKIAEIVSKFDVIAPVWEYTGISVWKRYASCQGQRRSDLQLIHDIIARKYPDYLASADVYLNGKGEYYGNIFIMRWEFFDAYCKWLFDILNEFDKQVQNPLPRTDGFLAERLFGIYFTWQQEQRNVSCAELPRIHFWGYNDANHRFLVAKFTNFFFPPGSKRCAVLRHLTMK